MNELTRAQYLDILGIDTFVPRFVLPAAKPSVLCDLPVANEQVHVSETNGAAVSGNQTLNRFPVTDDASGPSQSARSITSLLEGDANTSKAPSAPEESSHAENNTSVEQQVSSIVKETSVSDAAQKNAHAASSHIAGSQTIVTNAAKFSLGLWQSQDTLFVDSRRAGDALPTQALLLNIMHGVGLDNSALSKEEILNWPLVQKESDQSWQAARAMVTSFLDGRLFNRPCSRFLILGKDAYQAVIGEDTPYIEHLYAEIAIEIFDAKALVLPSLSDMLYKPELKRAVWIALQIFCAE